MTVVVVLGAPGAGKGTQAELLAERLAIPHVATGDLFRAAVRDGSPIGLEARRFMERGQLVPDDITIRMLLDRLSQPDAAGGAILDGFPRNGAQAQVLDDALAERGDRVDLAIDIEVPTDELIRRMSGRWVCRRCRACLQRVDEPAAACQVVATSTARRCSNVRTTSPRRSVRAWTSSCTSLREVLDHYRRTGILRSVDGLQPIDAVAQDVSAVAAAAGPKERA